MAHNYILRKPTNGVGIIIDVAVDDLNVVNVLRFHENPEIEYSQVDDLVEMLVGSSQPKMLINSENLYGYDGAGVPQLLSPLNATTLQELVDSNYINHGGGAVGSAMSILTMEASGGEKLENEAFVGKTIHIVAFNSLALNSGFTLSGSEISFSETTFEGGETVTIIFE